MAEVAAKVRESGVWPVVRKRWRGWLRSFHRDFGYLAIGFTVIYAISGIAQNHIEDWGDVSYKASERTVSIAAISDAATAEVHRRRGRDAKRVHAMLFPPVELDQRVAGSATPADEGCEAERRHPECLRMAAHELADRVIVKMVVVIVRLQHDVERRKSVERDSRRHPALGPSELRGRRSLAPHGIGENVQTIQLDQEAGMADPRNCELRCRRAWRYKRGLDTGKY